MAKKKAATASKKEAKKPNGPVLKLTSKRTVASPPKLLPKRPVASAEANPTEGMSPQDRINYVMDSVNKTFGGAVIRRANEADTSYSLRRPTGIPNLDIGLGGGFPAGALSVITGPDGAGKDYIINCAIREVQRNYGSESRVAILSTEFPYDKLFARTQAGVEVGFTEEEIKDLNRNRELAGADPLTDEETERYMSQVGDIVLIQGLLADHAFDVLLNLLDTGAFQFIAINSLGVMETVAKDDTESLEEHAIQSSEAQLLSRFIPKMFMYLNRPLSSGGRNETTLLAANQVRANRAGVRMKPGVPVPDHLKYQAGSGSRALAHGKAIDVMLHKGPDILDKSDANNWLKVGRTMNWELTKGKLGTHDGVKGSYDYFYSEGADLADNLLSQAVLHGIIEQAGAWYSFDDGETSFKVQGANKAADELRNPEFYNYVYRRVIAAAGVYCRYT